MVGRYNHPCQNTVNTKICVNAVIYKVMKFVTPKFVLILLVDLIHWDTCKVLHHLLSVNYRNFFGNFIQTPF